MVTFVVFGIDKWKAMHKRWRIPEATLLILAAVGGSIGAWAGMIVWHHKTKHKKFRYGVPLILVAQVVLVLLSSCGTKMIAEEPLPVTENDSQMNYETPLKDRVVRERVIMRERDSLRANGLEPDHSPNVFLVMYDPAVGKDALQKAIKEYGCETQKVEVVYDYRIIHGMALKKPDCKTLEETMEFFRGVEGVLSVEYDHIIRLDDPVRPRLEQY